MISETILDTVDAVFETLRLSNTKLFGDDVTSSWLFRGHADPEWRLVPQVWRDEFFERFPPPAELKRLISETSQRPLSATPWPGINHEFRDRFEEALLRLATEQGLFRNFAVVSYEAGLREAKPSHTSPLERLQGQDFGALLDQMIWETVPIQAQHHGIPTRLLDWTSDPLSAVYFATERRTPDPAEVSDSLVWAMETTRFENGERLGPFDPSVRLQLREVPRSVDPRVASQRGAFTFVWRGEHPYITEGRYPSVDEFFSGEPMLTFRLRLNAEDRFRLRTLLLRERRTRAHLMNDLDSVAEVAKDFLLSGILL